MEQEFQDNIEENNPDVMTGKENATAEQKSVEDAHPQETTEGGASADGAAEGGSVQPKNESEAGGLAGVTKGIKDKLSHLERKHYYWIGGVAALLIAGIIVLVAMSKNDDGESQSSDEKNAVFRGGDMNDVVEKPEQGFGINDNDSTKNDSTSNRPSHPNVPSTNRRNYSRTPTTTRTYSSPSPSSSRRSVTRPGTNRNSSQRQRRALLIGLGEQQDSSWYEINRGRKLCGDTDVQFVKATLLSCGYEEENIWTLVNEEAKKDSIVKTFEIFTKQCGKGDIVYVHFSGHGQRVKDQNGDERKDDRKNEDLYDESWIPYDAYMNPCVQDKGEKHLIDDEVNLLLNKIVDRIGNEGKLLVVVDACHSGSASRGDGEDEDSTVYRGGKDFVPQVDLKLKMPGPVRWLFVGACQDNQVNQEMRVVKDNKPQQVGKLSYAICSSLETNETITDSVLVKFFENHHGSLPQNPVIETTKVTYSISDVLK